MFIERKMMHNRQNLWNFAKKKYELCVPTPLAPNFITLYFSNQRTHTQTKMYSQDKREIQVVSVWFSLIIAITQISNGIGSVEYVSSVQRSLVAQIFVLVSECVVVF